MGELFAASLTPFASPGGGVDHDWIPRHLRWLEANGVDGVVPCGTTGEGPSLGFDERKAVIDSVLAHRGKLRVFAGTGCVALPETIAATRYALERGADVALVLPPYYFKNPSDAGLLAFYRAVCDALPPGGQIMLYHIPPISQIAIPTAVIDGLLASHPAAIYGLKDSGGDPEHTAMLIARYPQLKIFTGGAPLLARALADGAAGGIFALANVFPRELRAVLSAHAAGDNTATAQRKATALSDLLKKHGAIPSLKALVSPIADLPATSPRAPLVSLAEADAATLLAQARSV
ncbi:MAG TPA: dihydrodipicolinate synthase family protein [Kouleothrix sp.]|nr:dihydrodipicolinate synthase family protein [Kouleothrix sp.]HRC77892.1 dihydrodipicolinate synthase family protein [Kouleothrix sp.]